MHIYLMRHAEAAPPSFWRRSDADRPLSKNGIKKLEAGLAEMKRLGFGVPQIITSPLVRALETARLMSERLNAPAPIVRGELSSGAHHSALYQVVSEYAPKAPALFVGHMPEIAVFGTRLTNEPRVMDQGLLPADILAIETVELKPGLGDGTISWWRKIEDWKNVTS